MLVQWTFNLCPFHISKNIFWVQVLYTLSLKAWYAVEMHANNLGQSAQVIEKLCCFAHQPLLRWSLQAWSMHSNCGVVKDSAKSLWIFSTVQWVHGPPLHISGAWASTHLIFAAKLCLKIVEPVPLSVQWLVKVLLLPDWASLLQLQLLLDWHQLRLHLTLQGQTAT